MLTRLATGTSALTLSGGLALAVADTYPAAPVAPPFIEYRAANATASGCPNTGTGGSGYDLYLPAGVTAASVGPDPAANNQLAVTHPAGSYFRTHADMPASLCGQNPCTIELVAMVAGTSDGALLGWGAAQPGQARDIWVNGGAGGVIMQHIYGNSASLYPVPGTAYFDAYARMQQVMDGWSVQQGLVANPEPTLTQPLVSTPASPLSVGAGNYGVRSYPMKWVLIRFYPGRRTNAATRAANDEVFAQFGAHMNGA